FKMAFLKYMKGAIVGNEEPKFEVLSKTDDYELRSYTECRWVTLSIHDKTPEEFSRDEFKRLFDYINGKNETGISIEMTIPMVYHILNLLYLKLAPREIYVRTFGGMAKDADWKREFDALKAKLENPDDVDLSEYHRAAYDPPFKPFNRRNEVWVVKKTSSVVEEPQSPTD
ncbi:heme-binding protein 1, partial [Caerostris extrusa]